MRTYFSLLLSSFQLSGDKKLGNATWNEPGREKGMRLERVGYKKHTDKQTSIYSAIIKYLCMLGAR